MSSFLIGIFVAFLFFHTRITGGIQGYHLKFFNRYFKIKDKPSWAINMFCWKGGFHMWLDKDKKCPQCDRINKINIFIQRIKNVFLRLN